MATRTFTTMVQFKDMLNPLVTKAVSITCNRLLGTLQELIMSEYYDAFEPEKYVRSFQFYDSAMTKMVNNLMGEIFMDAKSMNYGAYWDGEAQLYMSAQGFHGTSEIQTEGRFWQAFIDFCENNAIRILKEELKKVLE